MYKADRKLLSQENSINLIFLYDRRKFNFLASTIGIEAINPPISTIAHTPPISASEIVKL